MLTRVREARPDARIDGFAVQPMAQRPHAHELIVGASIDAVFGPIVLFGQGGIAVEQWADRAIALPPLNRALAAELVARTRVSRLLAGFRDRPPAHAGAIHGTLIAVAQMLADWPQLAELDINPLWADEQGVLALDARVRLAREAPGGSARFAIRPYPAELVEDITWKGRKLVVRPIRPEDEAQHLAFLERLDPEDVRMRVFYARTELPRSELARLTQIDYEREMAFIATERDADGQQHTLGVVRAISDPDNSDAEFAIVVRSDLKGQGLGRLLMGRMIDYARSRGTRRLVGDVLSENTAMLKLARMSGFTIDASGSDAGVVHIVRPLQGEAGAG
jgi:acetyltransferase